MPANSTFTELVTTTFRVARMPAQAGSMALAAAP